MEEFDTQIISCSSLFVREQLLPKEFELSNEITYAITMLEEEQHFWRARTLTGKRIRELKSRLQEIKSTMYNISFNPFSVFTSMSIIGQIDAISIIRHSKNGGRPLEESRVKKLNFSACITRVRRIYKECLQEYSKNIQFQAI